MPLLKATAEHLRKAINLGYKTTADEDFDVRDHQMLKQLQQNVYVFSGYKTYEQLRQITDLLLDKKGNVKPFEDFKTDVLKLSQKHNATYLSAEYDHAIVSAQSASQWQQIQRTKNVLPILQFDATLDRRTTDVCRNLDGLTLPADDPTWNQYFLPLHWGERSVIRQRATGTISDLEKFDFPELQPMFKNNVGKTGVAFPESHPYYDVSKSDKKQIDIAVKKATPKQLQETFTTVKSGKQSIKVSNFVNKEESIYNKKIGFAMAKHFKTDDVYVLGEFYDKVNPDLKIKGKMADIKTPEADKLFSGISSSLQNAVSQRYRQMKKNTPEADLIKTIIIDLKNYKSTNDEIIKGAIKFVLNGKKASFFEVITLHKGKVKTF